MLHDWNDTARPDPVRPCFPSCSSAGCAHARTRWRWSCDEQQLTYARARRARRTGWRTTCAIARACGPRRVVALCVRALARPGRRAARHPQGRRRLPAARPGYPAERLAFMLADADAPVLVTHAALLDQLPAHGARRGAARCRLACDRAAARDARRASAAAPRNLGLRDLHVGLDRHAEGRGGRPCAAWPTCSLACASTFTIGPDAGRAATRRCAFDASIVRAVRCRWSAAARRVVGRAMRPESRCAVLAARSAHAA